MQAWALVDGKYVEAAASSGAELVELISPFPVSFRPQELFD
ncbi:hypothetical protein [Microlunatus elymi]|nr:hypothetical protein [Microlunatus elymi]